MAGCALSVWVRSSCCAARSLSLNTGMGKVTAWLFKPADRAASHASMAASNSRASSLPMPTYWLPCPGNRKAKPPAGAPTPKWMPSGRVHAVSGLAEMASAAAFSFSASSSDVAAMMASRAGALASKRAAVSRARKPSAVGCWAAKIPWARAASATSAPDLPDTNTMWCERESRRGAFWSPVYSSTARWKLDPPKPNELTPARRGWSSLRTQGRVSVFR